VTYHRDMVEIRRRLRSWWWDYLVVLAWLLLVFVAVGLPGLLGWLDLDRIWSRPLTADLAVTALTVVPYYAYLVGTEAAPAHATWGKRRSGLVVTAADGSPPGGTGIAVRNLVKVLPWQFGHMAAMRFATGAGGVAPAVACWVVSVALLALVVGPALAGRRGVHDLSAGTVVRPARTRA